MISAQSSTSQNALTIRAASRGGTTGELITFTVLTEQDMQTFSGGSKTLERDRWVEVRRPADETRTLLFILMTV